MGVISTLPRFRAESAPPPPDSDFWYRATAPTTMSGVRVDENRAMHLSALFACRRAIAQPIGMIPMHVIEYLPNGGKRRAPIHPLYPILHDAPNPEMTAMEFREMLTAHAVFRGDGFALIKPDIAAGQPVGSLWPVEPDAVQTERLPDGTIRYKVHYQDGHYETVLFDEMFKVRGMTLDGINGCSVLEYAREGIGRSLAMDSYSSRFFSNGTRIGGVIQSTVTDVDKRRQQAAEFSRQYGGVDNAYKTAFLPPGYEWKPTAVNNKDAQWLEAQQFDLGNYERWFGVPAHIISDLMRATFSNIEEQAIEYVVYTLNPWGVRWEQSISRDLIVAKGRFRGEFLWDALLRGKTLDRYTAHGMAIRDGWKTRNEVRENENLNAEPGLDDFLLPKNMVETSQLGQQVQQAQATARVFALDAASRVIRREVNAVAKAAKEHADDGAAWEAFVNDFYAEHADAVERTLHVTAAKAQAVCEQHRRELLKGGVAVVERWELEGVTALAALALEDAA